MTTSPTNNRRRLQFSLRTLLVVVTLCAIWLAHSAHQVGQRRRFLDSTRGGMGITDGLKQLGRPENPLPFALWLIGARRVGHLNLNRERFTESEIIKLRYLFPEADVYVYGERRGQPAQAKAD